jgi:hypothetical protein
MPFTVRSLNSVSRSSLVSQCCAHTTSLLEKTQFAGSWAYCIRTRRGILRILVPMHQAVSAPHAYATASTADGRAVPSHQTSSDILVVWKAPVAFSRPMNNV